MHCTRIDIHILDVSWLSVETNLNLASILQQVLSKSKEYILEVCSLLFVGTVKDATESGGKVLQMARSFRWPPMQHRDIGRQLNLVTRARQH